MAWLEALPLGASASTAKTFTEADTYQYVGIVGDFNPVYVDEEAAKREGLSGRTGHWAMLAGCLGVVAAEVTRPITPPGTVSVRYDISFQIPMEFGGTITTTFTLAEKWEDRQELVFDATFTNQRGEVIGGGRAYSKVARPA
jgi:3-hydroxybutyryl-CoA dehydratase